MTTDIEPRIVICIPGKWRNIDELAQQLSAHSSTFSLADNRFVDRQLQVELELQVTDYDPRMAQAFRALGPHWVETAAMDQINEHTLVVYLTGHGGSHPQAISLMLAAAALVKAGGLGVKIESSGIAHSPEAWIKLADERHLFSAHEAFVAYVTGDDLYTCGMHGFGLRDAVIAIGEADDPLTLLRVFTWYLFTETPAIRSGQIFSVAEEQPRYRLVEEACTQYEVEELFKNQYGMWRLARVVE
jgi:hypothetical protein